MIKTFFQPLHAVSGNLYNYFWTLHGDTIFGFVADVTGHGVTAALRTSALSALFQEAAGLSLPLMERAKWVHGRSLAYFSEGAYFAAICFELDLRHEELKVVCGGLYEFFIHTHYYSGSIQLTGSLMGLQRTPVFEERIYPAKAGDCFYFLSDGFSEQLECTEFPLQTFQDSCDYLQKLRTSAAAWDDMAGLCIQIKPNEQFSAIQPPELQLHFVGFTEFHVARIRITAFVEKNFPQDADDILLAFHEAASNALRHGSALLPAWVRIHKGTGYMSIRIKDSGQGFPSRKYLAIAHSTMENTKYSRRMDSGRGIKLMLECMDKVYYNSIGNEVLLLKKIKIHS
jgi:anti-sigma regulatory factor (Ser/Thr protein kinase)